MRKLPNSLLLAGVGLAFACGSDEIPEVDSVPDYPTYVEHIRPFLADHCLLCHGAKPRNGAPSDFRLDVYEDTGKKKGAGSMAEVMADMLERGKMPPTGNGVGPNARKMFRKWADLGAPKEPCVPACEGRSCGDDGCGGSCGGCEGGLSCDDGICVGGCVPSCDGSICGDDGCGGSCGSCQGGFSCEAGDCFPDEETTLGLDDVWEIVSARCLECHGKGEGGLVMGSTPESFYDAVVWEVSHCLDRPYVVPMEPDKSYIVHKVEGRAGICGSRMPYGKTPLRAGQIATVRKWIADGALED